MPEISVIVPVYRAEAFLRKCTESILAQTMGDLEVLLIDDGSPDGSGAVIWRNTHQQAGRHTNAAPLALYAATEQPHSAR